MGFLLLSCLSYGSLFLIHSLCRIFYLWWSFGLFVTFSRVQFVCFIAYSDEHLSLICTAFESPDLASWSAALEVLSQSSLSLPSLWSVWDIGLFGDRVGVEHLATSPCWPFVVEQRFGTVTVILLAILVFAYKADTIDNRHLHLSRFLRRPRSWGFMTSRWHSLRCPLTSTSLPNPSKWYLVHGSWVNAASVRML